MSPEEYIETKRGWVHKFRKPCPHCNLPIDIEIYIPLIPPKPALKMKGGVKAKATLKIDLPQQPPSTPPEEE